MVDMELVIKLSDEDYKKISNSNPSYADDFSIYYAIKNGTPLPKHGRLIDADALKKNDEVTEWLALNAVRTGKMLKSFSELFIKKIDNTPTIIEADRAESEVQE